MRKHLILAGGAILAAATGIGFITPAATDVVEAAPAVAPSPAAVDTPLGLPVPPSEPPADTGLVSDADKAPSAESLETFTGSASYYADKFEGRTTASGVPFRQSRMWAAHRTLPFGTRLRVTNPDNGRAVEVEVVDRGPFIRGRVLDLSRSAAGRLGLIRAGHAVVEIEVLERGGR